jgi:hypothetical protein
MADTKISALTAATTPLAGTEVLPIVQSGATVKVAVSDLTAGRAISATQLTLTTGNVIVASGQGIDFSATPGTGTSELLSDYEEGTWTPAQGAGLVVVGAFSSNGTYTKVGRIVTISGLLIGATSINTTAAGVMTNGLPFTGASPATGTAVSASLASDVGTVLSGADIYSTGSLGASAYIFFSSTYMV